MSDKTTDSSVPLAEISHGPSKFESFLENNQKLLLVLAILIALGAVSYVVISGIQKGKQEAAGAKLIQAADADELKAVVTQHAGTQAAKSAELLLAESQWMKEETKDASIATLEGFIADNKDHPALPTAKASLASKWMVLGKTDKAVSLFNELANGQDRYIAPFALVSLGDIAASAGDTEKAEAHYKRVTAEYATSQFASAALFRLNDLGAVPPTEIPAPQPKKGETPDGDLSGLPSGGTGTDEMMKALLGEGEEDAETPETPESTDKNSDNNDVSDQEDEESKKESKSDS